MKISWNCERSQRTSGREAVGSRRRDRDDESGYFMQGVETRACGVFLEAWYFLGDPIQSLIRENGFRPEEARSFHFGIHFGTQETCGRYGPFGI